MAANLFIGQHLFSDLQFISIHRYLDLTPQFAINLNSQLTARCLQRCGIDLWPTRIEKLNARIHELPQTVGNMGHHW